MRHLLFSVLLFISPLTATAETLLTINGTLFTVELAISQEEQHRGLMQRQTLAPNHGMLFVYQEPQRISFWMKQTLIPLDILFFDGDGRLTELFENAPPCKRTPCKTYTNEMPAVYVLELPAGSARKNGLRPGDSFQIVQPE